MSKDMDLTVLEIVFSSAHTRSITRFIRYERQNINKSSHTEDHL